MQLVMFDIDGTLTETMRIDEECFVRSFAEVFGFTDIDTDWSHYPHVTDSGIFHEVYASRQGRAPTAPDVSRFRRRFIELLAAASSQSPFAPVAGWGDSARLKMASAGMCFDGHPAASADDALERESIMELSKRRARECYGEPFAGTVYVGDGVWDARASRALGIPFIGIGSGVRAARLASEGAVRVFQDFSEDGLFLETLEGLSRGVHGAKHRD